MFKRLFISCVLSAALAAPASAAAQKAEEDPRALAATMLAHHPDLQYRAYGVEAHRKKDYERALVLFRRAAYFADKPSQAMIAEMHQRGAGVERDPALAYAWMDLAAERGYPQFVALRERYWESMDEATRQRALQEGEALYSRYGDAAAKPRFATQLRRASKEIVGSRTGFAGNAKVTVPGPFGDETIDGTKFKDVSYWDADKYWAMQDRAWRNPKGRKVNVGDVEVVRPDAVRSRVPETTPDVDAPMPDVDRP